MADIYTPSISEKLTKNFYLWEQRGRGWFLWEAPVELEPPFEPFHRHRVYAQPVIDDGRKHTFLSSLIEKLKNPPGPVTPQIEAVSQDSGLVEYIATPYEDCFPLREMGIILPAENKISSEYTEQLLLNLGSCAWPLSYEVIGSHDSIGIQIACREPDVGRVKGELFAFFPEATVSEGISLIERLPPDGRETIVVDFGLNQEFMRPLRTFKGFDPETILGIFGVLEHLEPDEV